MIIHGWGAIAQYLGMAESTVRRAHEEHPMPLKRLTQNGRVMIRESQLKAWYEALPGSENEDERT